VGSYGAAIGSGGPYALAAARALIDLPDYTAKTIGEHLSPCNLLASVTRTDDILCSAIAARGLLSRS
jgi:ATP-dependent protease HslVU (ClpYQ) peptidase subunit